MKKQKPKQINRKGWGRGGEREGEGKEIRGKRSMQKSKNTSKTNPQKYSRETKTGY